MNFDEYRGIQFFITRTDDEFRSYALIDGAAVQCQHEPVEYPEIARSNVLNYIDGFMGNKEKHG